jgi:hypothetical protein
MTPTIKLDRQFRARTIEIENIGIDRVLPPELVTRKIPVSQTAPENPFTICRLLSERSSVAHKRTDWLAKVAYGNENS